MVDYNFNVPTVQPMQQPNMMQAYGQMQQIQANRMMMEERTRALQEQNALRSLLAGGIRVGTPEFTEGAARISPELGLRAETSRLANVREQRTAEAQQAQAENARIQTMRTLGQIGADKVAQYRNGLATLDPSDPAAYGAWYSVAAPEFKKVGATLPPPDRWNAQTKGALLQTADSFLATAKETAPGVQMVEGIPYQRTVVDGQIRLTPIQPTQEGVPSARFGIAPVDGAARPLQTPVNPALNNSMAPFGGLPSNNAFVQQPEAAPLTFQQIAERKKEVELAQKGATERQSLAISKEFDETKKQEVRGEFDKTLGKVVEQYQTLGKQGALIAPETGVLGRIKAVAAGALPTGAVTIAAPERAAPIAALSNLRQTMLSALMGATGMSSKAIDSNAEMTAYLNSLSTPGQPVQAIADTLNSLSERFGKGRPITAEDLTGGKPQTPEVPAGRRAAAAPAIVSSAMPPAAVTRLKANPSEAAQFDEIFGAGAAAKILGR